MAAVLVAAACGSNEPAELVTAAGPSPAVVPLKAPRPTEPTTTTTSTTVPPTTTTTVAPPPPTTTTTAPYVAPPPTVAAPAPTGGSCGGLEPAVAVHFPASEVGTACRVIACETGGTFSPTIHNQSSSASGIFQFLDSTWTSTTGLPPPAAGYSLDQQLAAGAALWRSSGWSPWSCY